MKYVIFKIEEPTLMVQTLDSQYNPQLTNDVDNAMLFDSETEALAMIGNMEGTTEFWGARPKRPK
jgi:hypothetical protein